jgi:hypothetical protein
MCDIGSWFLFQSLCTVMNKLYLLEASSDTNASGELLLCSSVRGVNGEASAAVGVALVAVAVTVIVA